MGEPRDESDSEGRDQDDRGSWIGIGLTTCHLELSLSSALWVSPLETVSFYLYSLTVYSLFKLCAKACNSSLDLGFSSST